MPDTITSSALSGAKSMGRPVPPAIALVEAMVEEIAHEENCAERLNRTIDFLERIRVIGGRLESDLVKLTRTIVTERIPEIRDAAGLAEQLYLRGEAA